MTNVDFNCEMGSWGLFFCRVAAYLNLSVESDRVIVCGPREFGPNPACPLPAAYLIVMRID